MRQVFVVIALLVSLLPAGAQTQETGQAATIAMAEDTGGVSTQEMLFRICPPPKSLDSSARYLRDTARCAFGESTTKADLIRVALIEDIFIKAWSYGWINKLCFYVAVVLAILVLCWPAFASTMQSASANDHDNNPDTPDKPRGWLHRAASNASVQTSITALAALAFAVYGHYKQNQVAAEGLMRTMLYAEVVDQQLVDQTISSIREMDSGFRFASYAEVE